MAVVTPLGILLQAIDAGRSQGVNWALFLLVFSVLAVAIIALFFALDVLNFIIVETRVKVTLVVGVAVIAVG